MKISKKALIIGVTGQDGAYLSRLLLNKGYEVHGIRRRSSSFNTSRIDDLVNNFHKFELHYGDITDSESLLRIISRIKPDEIYNLAAQSHVAVSFIQPTYTIDVDGLGVSRILEIIENLQFNHTKFYQASTSEMFGSTPPPQNEKSPFSPQSPYGAAKVMAYWLTVQKRQSSNLFASNGILFNHESPIRGETFVSRKIVKSLVNYKINKSGVLQLGNLYSNRDWGHARDYAEAQWLILQSTIPDDYVISTDQMYSVKDFINFVSTELGLKLEWQGQGIDESAIDSKGRRIVTINKKYFRPLEVDNLRGDSSKARKTLNWAPKTSLHDLIKEMIDYEFAIQLNKKPLLKWINDESPN